MAKIDSIPRDLKDAGVSDPCHTFKKKKLYVPVNLFWLAGSSLLHGPFSSCGKQRLLSSCTAKASHCSGFS